MPLRSDVRSWTRSAKAKRVAWVARATPKREAIRHVAWRSRLLFCGRLLRRGLLRRRLLLRDLLALAPSFGEADRDRLLPALHFLAGGAGLQRSLLPLVHRLADL